MCLLGINPPAACQRNKKNKPRMGESSKDGKGFISHPQQRFFKQPRAKQAFLKSAIWVA